jgi:thioredoxin reductase
MTVDPDERPFPPGEYPVMVVGSGPGALQLSYSLGRLGVPHAVISADDAPGGMFRRWPFFQRLLSWTKPFAPVERGTPEYERYDWNSLLPDEPEHRANQARYMDGSSYFPSRPEMERNLVEFAAATGLRIRHGCRWESTRIEEGRTADDRRFVLGTTDGEYRCRTAVFAIGIAQPWSPSTPGIELAAHYSDTRPAETYAGRRIFIIGKQNSGFELASGLLQWAAGIVLSSPSPATLSVVTNSLVGIRARYLQPYEDHILGGGVGILDASTESITRAPGAGTGGPLVARLRRSDGAGSLAIEIDEVIAATGFITPLQDLAELGVATFGHSRLPAQTPWWESVTVPGIFFAGTITQGATGLKKHGMPSNSGAVHGARYNARILAAEIARRSFGIERERPAVPGTQLADFLLAEAAHRAELWHQKAYLASVVSVSANEGVRDAGIVPLAAFLDDESGGDGAAITLEADGTGAIYPVVYVRVSGTATEVALDAHPLLDFTTREHRAQLAAAVAPLLR